MNQNDLIFKHLNVCAALVQNALRDAAAEDSEGAAGLARAMKAGAMLELQTTLTTTGLAKLSISVTAPSGESLGELMACELRRELHQ